MYKLYQRKVKDNPEEYFSNHMITKVVIITTNQQHGLDFMEQIIVIRENDKPGSFCEADFKYLNKNDIEDLVHDFQLVIESYQITLNLTTQTLTYPGIEAYDPYSIVDGFDLPKQQRRERVMYLAEIVKFCDATIERVLKEVKLKIFKSNPWKKPPLLDCNPFFKEKGSVRFSALYLKKKRNLLVFTSVDMIVMTSMVELESLFGHLFDELSNGENQVVSKSSDVSTADAFDKPQQQQDSTSSTSSLATTISASAGINPTRY
ncbi:hypothetical protein Tco_1026945 [Tanacetum coccineum]